MSKRNRNCRKCGEHIPYRITIEGKPFNLNNRKFCINCSPFKQHNTSPYDPLDRKSKKWKDFSKERKDRTKLSLYKRGLQRRRELYQAKGGKCQKCGYCKCERALTFHHKNPQDKKFGLSLNNLWCKTQEEINQEANKCDLLCSNCHAEIEDAIARKTSIVKKVNETYGTDF